jgi:hypothetical protein
MPKLPKPLTNLQLKRALAAHADGLTVRVLTTTDTPIVGEVTQVISQSEASIQQVFGKTSRSKDCIYLVVTLSTRRS